ncbi:MAG: molybdate ABC transporter substrate-binding protein [Burkholderiales bacterium]|nr:molybdate ABC transporter substrate-binding protein [Burkholderiales bacterium]
MNTHARKGTAVVRSLVAMWLLWSCGMPAWAADITVSAAASLTNAFQDIGREFESANPGSKVLFNFGSSGQLVQQITRGAPVDAFAAADQESMDRAEKGGAIERGSRFNFVRNEMVVVVPTGATTTVSNLADLGALAFTRIAIGNPESVPAGRYAKLALDKAGLWDALKERMVNTQNVRQALDYVARGEVDAGFVYASDARLLPARVKAAVKVDVPADILYPVAATRGGGNQRGGLAFVEFLKTETAQRILARYGFLKP